MHGRGFSFAWNEMEGCSRTPFIEFNFCTHLGREEGGVGLGLEGGKDIYMGVFLFSFSLARAFVGERLVAPLFLPFMFYHMNEDGWTCLGK